MKIGIAFLLVASASAFAPSAQRPFVRQPALHMGDENDAALVPIKQETVEFTAGIIGGVAGFVVGGPVLGAIGAAISNFVSKQEEGELTEVVSAVSESSIQAFNFLSKLDAKYDLLEKSKNSLESALDKAKSSDSANPETVEKIENALSSTKAKLNEINDEYDLVGAGTTALGVVGDLVEQAIKKAGELNEEYQLTDKALESLNGAVSKAKDAASKA